MLENWNQDERIDCNRNGLSCVIAGVVKALFDCLMSRTMLRKQSLNARQEGVSL